jgi:hypothetical protein
MKRGQSRLTFAATTALLLALALPARAQLPQDWVAKDIGDVGVPGSTTVDSATGKWTIKGAGRFENADTSETFHFAHQVVKGDGSIVARITQQRREGGTSPKSGPMIRVNDTPGSPYYALIMTTSTIALQDRTEQDGDSERINDQAERKFPSDYLRIQRVGNVVSGFVSTDGRVWKPVEEATRELSGLGENALFGLAVSSRDETQLTTVIFDNVAVLPGQVSVTGLKTTTNDKGTLVEWTAAKGAVGYNIYSGPAGADFSKMKKLNTDPQTGVSFVDPSSANAAAGSLSIAVSAVFMGADNKPVEGPLVLASEG